MAVDTRSKRASVLGLGLGIALTLPLVDGTVGQPDRQHVAYSYAGIQAAILVTEEPASYVVVPAQDRWFVVVPAQDRWFVVKATS